MVEVKGGSGELEGFGCLGRWNVDGVTFIVVMSRIIENGGGEEGVRGRLKEGRDLS